VSKRLPFAGVMATAILLALPAVSGAQAPTQDSVTGQGTAVDPSFDVVFFNIDAQSGPSGENPSGNANFVGRAGSQFGGAITCLNVEDDVATFNFVDTALSLGVVTVEATDAGDEDTLFWVFGERSADDCSPLPSGPRFRAFGSIVVVDTHPPLPTSKDQCKNGGWRSYGVFKNQGDCVSFVATGGKNPPANNP
jgi:hypothetical protein